MKHFNYIASLLLLVLAFATAEAQVIIGDGLTISEGTTMHIQNQDVVINTKEIKGKGNLTIQNDSTQKLNIVKNLQTSVDLSIHSEDIEVDGDSKQYFALHFLPPLSSEVIAAKKEQKIEETLPIKHINFEGKSFKIEDNQKEQNQAEFTMGFDDFSTAVVIVDVLQVKGAKLNSDYIIPIYSSSINNERFSDYAKLYKFECLTALLKPPIV